MILGGIALGLIAGIVAGGSLQNLVSVGRLRWVGFILAALGMRLSLELLLRADPALATSLRLPFLLGAYVLLAIGLWRNVGQPGMGIALVGVLLNGTAILVNGGAMPIWEPSLIAAGLDPAAVTSPIHVILPAPLDAYFLLHAGPLADIIPIPVPYLQNVASIGDIFLASGLAVYLFASVVRRPAESAATSPAGRPFQAESTDFGPATTESGLPSAIAEAATLERSISLGSSAAGVTTPTMRSTASSSYIPGRVGPLVRLRGHPFVRLALNGSFSSLWVGQLISLFGDRIHQIALAAIVFAATNSLIAVTFAFVAAALPNLILSPFAGTLVDRWDQKQTMVVSDLLRAAVVFVLPVAALTNVLLVFPLAFILTSISLFFRPARAAVTPRIVGSDELVTANSALWMGETVADIVGYPLAGLFVAFLGSALPLAFWIDGATYMASAVLIATMHVPPVSLRAAPGVGLAGFRRDLVAGWTFLRGEATLLASTIQAVFAQLAIGVLIALTFLYASEVLGPTGTNPNAAYAFLETGVGIGNLVGGFFVGIVGGRLARGRLIIAGYVMWGLCCVGLGLTGNLAIAIGLAVGQGFANMVFVIPSQTLMQERTPIDFIGRVVSFRFALVYGALTIAMAASGVLATIFGVAPVIVAFGCVTIAAGLAGLLVPALRDA